MTFSIVAKDPNTGAFGVATATGGPAVGSLVPYARANTGAVATQGYTTNPFYGFEAIELFAAGEEAQNVLNALVQKDEGRERRQCVMIDRNGNTAGWTGNQVNTECGEILRTNVGVAGNLLASQQVLKNLLAAFEQAESRPLEDRLLLALTAAETAGGDKRGTQSAAIKTYTNELYPAVDIRADLSNKPISKLADILAETRAHAYADFFSRVPTHQSPSSS